jgi:hypothetical protein
VAPSPRRIRECLHADISACGTALRKPVAVHTEIECRERGHTICVVCTEIWFSV